VGWLQSKRRRQPLEPATFEQTLVIVCEALTPPNTPLMSYTDVTEWSIQRHLALGFQYDKAQIHRAIDALTDPAAGSPSVG
jgi:hypothetical protein